MFARLPMVFSEVDCEVFAHFDAFALEQLRLDLGAAERERRRKSAFAVDDAVAGDDARARIGVQCISDRARRVRRADHTRDLSVGRDLAARDELHCFIDIFEKAHIHLYVIVTCRADRVNGRASEYVRSRAVHILRE